MAGDVAETPDALPFDLATTEAMGVLGWIRVVFVVEDGFAPLLCALGASAAMVAAASLPGLRLLPSTPEGPPPWHRRPG
jgi:hypothetical protein